MNTIEIVTVRNELLPGNAVGTNTNWLCKHIFLFNEKVRRAIMVADELTAITPRS